MDACRLDVKNRKTLENYYYLVLKRQALKENNTIHGPITNAFKKEVVNTGRSLIPSSFVTQQLLSVAAQDSIHDCLERIFTRNGNSYDNPKLIAKALCHGLTPEAIALITREKQKVVVDQVTATIKIGANGKRQRTRKGKSKKGAQNDDGSDQSVIDTGIILKPSAFNNNDNAKNSTGNDNERLLNESYTVKRRDVDDIIQLSKAGNANRQVLIIYGINHHVYFGMVKTYMRSLFPFLITYFANTSPDLVPSINSWYHRKMYIPPYTFSTLHTSNVPVDANATIILDRDVSGPELRALKTKYPNAYIAEMGCSRVILSLGSDTLTLPWIIPTSIPINEARALLKMNGDAIKDTLFRTSYLEYDPTFKFNSRAVTLLKNYTMTGVNPIRHPLRGSIDRIRADEIIQRMIDHRDGKYDGVVSFGIIADKGVGKTIFSLIFKELLLNCGIVLSVIDSDDYGRWLSYLVDKYGPFEDIPDATMQKELDDPNIRSNLGPISFFNVIMTNLAVKFKLNSFQKVDLLRNETELHPIFEAFKTAILPCFGKSLTSIQKYYEYVIQRCESRVILVESHTTLENVRALPSDLFVRLITIFFGDITIKWSRAEGAGSMSKHYLFKEGRNNSNMVHIGEYLLYYYYHRYTVQDVVAVTPSYFISSTKLVPTKVIDVPSVTDKTISDETSMSTRSESGLEGVTDSTPVQEK